MEFEERNITVLSDQFIELDSGIQLEATIYLPKGSNLSKFPSILVYNLYAKGWNIDNKAIEAAMRGYAGVLVYPRGKGKSTGKVAPFLTEAEDGYHILDWISEQKWSDQRIGMLGGSYLGFAQWAVTKRLHPSLKTIVPSASVVPGFNDNLTENGILRTDALPWFHLVTNNKTMDFGTYYDSKWGDVYRDFYNKGLAFKDLSSLWPLQNESYNNWLANQGSEDYWLRYMPDESSFKNLDIPVLATTGYYDHAQLGTWYYAQKHFKNNPNAEHYILIGPYDHLGANGMPSNTVNGYEIDQVAHININGLIFDWFDYVFFDKSKPNLLVNDVNYQLMGSSEWRSDSFQDYDKGKSNIFYLAADNKGNEINRLTSKPPLNIGSFIEQEVDYTDRNSVNSPFSRMVLASTLNPNNAIVFESVPFEVPINYAGHLAGRFSVSINKNDFDVAAVLYEKKKNGNYLKLTHYKARASHHIELNGRTSFTPGEKTVINIENTPFFSRKVEKGSKLVLVVSALKESRSQLNYGSTKSVNEQSLSDAGGPLIVKWHSGSFISLIEK